MNLAPKFAALAIGLTLATVAGAQNASAGRSGASGQMSHSAGKREHAVGGPASRSHKTARPNRKGGARTNAAGQTMSTNGPSYNAGGTNPDGSLPH